MWREVTKFENVSGESQGRSMVIDFQKHKARKGGSGCCYDIFAPNNSLEPLIQTGTWQ
jgi:hypothetical protein